MSRTGSRYALGRNASASQPRHMKPRLWKSIGLRHGPSWWYDFSVNTHCFPVLSPGPASSCISYQDSVSVAHAPHELTTIGVLLEGHGDQAAIALLPAAPGRHCSYKSSSQVDLEVKRRHVRAQLVQRASAAVRRCHCGRAAQEELVADNLWLHLGRTHNVAALRNPHARPRESFDLQPLKRQPAGL
ncbi:hypothetical protein HYQ44_003725 [Verticillium longisporum]|nr:hypothetical protein HYQ44_003725 [Verticillium longisporum]